jgi:hypothetical protein
MFEKRVAVRRILACGHLAVTVPDGRDLKVIHKLFNDNGLSAVVEGGPAGGTGAVQWR